jgi:dihydrofolate reductase
MINIIVAISNNLAIGKDNKLLWHLPNDLKFFKKTTTGHPVIMGRKTFEAIGKPLPNRLNIVISRNKKENQESLVYCNSLEEAIALAKTKDEEIFIIGGGEIYKQSLAIADTLYITQVNVDIDGDTFFPEIDNTWHPIFEEAHLADEKHPYDYTFLIYRKKPNS